MFSRQVFCPFILIFYTPKKPRKRLILKIKMAGHELDTNHGLA